MKQAHWLAVLLLILVAALIIPRLNDQSLWLDEAWTFSFLNHDSPREVVREVIHDRHPPLYFLSLWAWRQAAGDSEVALRLPSALAALLAGACVFRWGGELFGREAGLAALLIFALMDKQVDFSSEVRHYTFLMLWNAAAGWMLVRWLKGQKAGFGYVLAVTGGLYTHALMLLILMVHGLFALVTLRVSRRLIGLWGFAALAFSPWMLVFVYQYTVLGSIHHTFPFTWEVVRLLIPEFLGSPVTLSGGLVILAVLLSKSRAVLMPFGGVVVPLALIVGLGFFNERNLSIIIPPLAVLIGLGVTRFEGFTRRALVVFLLVNGLFTTDAHQILYEDGRYITTPRQQNPPWRELSRLVADRQIDSQPVLTEVGSGTMPMDYHLMRSIGSDVRHVALYDLTRRKDELDPLTALRFEALPNVEGFWYVYWGGDTLFLDALESWGYTRTATYQQSHRGDPIYVFRYDSAALLDQEMIVFGDLFWLHRTNAPSQVSAGKTVWVSLWWSAVQAPDRNYTVSVFLLDDSGRLVAQHDGFPQENKMPTLQWTPGVLVYDVHPIPIPAGLPPGRYTLAVKIYAESGVLATDSADEFYVAGVIRVRP